MGETEQMAGMYHNFRTQPVYPTIPGQPRRKTLLFTGIQVTFDYELKEMTVGKADDPAEKVTFSEQEILELKAALRSFGMEVETR